nr:MAG TPA: hypothetical protein [Caudoviricetes sp.]
MMPDSRPPIRGPGCFSPVFMRIDRRFSDF